MVLKSDACWSCGGEKIVRWNEHKCCGKPHQDGECCGQGVPEPHEMTCPRCLGTGKELAEVDH